MRSEGEQPFFPINNNCFHIHTHTLSFFCIEAQNPLPNLSTYRITSFVDSNIYLNNKIYFQNKALRKIQISESKKSDPMHALFIIPPLLTSPSFPLLHLSYFTPNHSLPFHCLLSSPTPSPLILLYFTPTLILLPLLTYPPLSTLIILPYFPFYPSTSSLLLQIPSLISLTYLPSHLPFPYPHLPPLVQILISTDTFPTFHHFSPFSSHPYFPT